MKKRSLFSHAAEGAAEEPVEAVTASSPFGDRIGALHDTAERVSARLRRVDPAQCRMWQYHNRDYDLLTEDNCRDLIDSIVAQGGQEQPAIVRELKGEGTHRFEVIAGARRHFAISWLRDHNYPEFQYYVEVRDLEDDRRVAFLQRLMTTLQGDMLVPAAAEVTLRKCSRIGLIKTKSTYPDREALNKCGFCGDPHSIFQDKSND